MASNLTLQRRSQRAAEESAAFGPIAERFRRAGDLDRAISLCREGLRKFPDHISARVTLGWSLLDQGKFDDARVELEQVLRRAPDNLAAIRGLAELHDRAEHTMNLPMDGPGQWPPTEESLDQAAAPDVFDPEIDHGASVDALKTAVQFADEGTPEVDVQIHPDAPAVFTSSSGAALDVKIDSGSGTVAEPEAESQSEPQAHTQPAAEPVAKTVVQEAAPAAQAASEPAAVEHDHVEPDQAEQAHAGMEADMVSEADIAALLAEAEKLEAAAAETEVGVTEDATGEIELQADEAFSEQPTYADEATEAVAQEVTEAVSEASAVEAVAEAPVVEAVAEQAAYVEQVAEPVAEQVAYAEEVTERPTYAEEVAEVVTEEVTETVAEAPAVEAVAEQPVEAVAEEPVEAVAEAAAEPVAEPVVAEPVAARIIETLADERDRFGLSDRIIAASIEHSVAHFHLAEIVPMARAARSDPNATTLVKLERFLEQVQARRRELMRQSVA